MRLILLLLFISSNTQAQNNVAEKLRGNVGRVFFEENANGEFEWKRNNSDSTSTENPRLVAIALNITLGVFGMHRIYLGTDVKVPVFYTLTLGGGMVLWVVDLGFLIFSKDIERFRNNPGIFMWSRDNEWHAEKTE